MDIIPFSQEPSHGFSLIGKLCSLTDYQKIRNHFFTMPTNHTTVVLDLKRLTFSSIQGINLLCEISHLLKKTGVTLILFKPQEELRLLLHLLNVDSIMPLIVTDGDLEKFTHKDQLIQTQM